MKVLAIPRILARTLALTACILSCWFGSSAQRSAGYLSASLGIASASGEDGTPMGELKLTIPVMPCFHMGLGADYIRFSGSDDSFCPVFADLVAVLNPRSKGEQLFFTVQPGFGIYSQVFNFTGSSLIQKTRGAFCLGAGAGTWIPVSRRLKISVEPKYFRLGTTTTRENTVTHDRTSSSSHGDVYIIQFGIRI